MFNGKFRAFVILLRHWDQAVPIAGRPRPRRLCESQRWWRTSQSGLQGSLL